MPTSGSKITAGLTRANGDRFRQMVLSRGNTEDLGKDVLGLARRRTEHRAHAEVSRVAAGGWGEVTLTV